MLCSCHQHLAVAKLLKVAVGNHELGCSHGLSPTLGNECVKSTHGEIKIVLLVAVDLGHAMLQAY
jgi:hypothetical protein